ncbi:MAG: AzlD domain-containing protein [Thermomicrobiales bacterium]
MDGTLGLILAVALVSYVTKFAGLALGARTIPEGPRGFLEHMPIAVFAALAVPGIGGWDGDLPARLVGAALATVVVVRWRSLWLALALGMTGFWLTGALVG